MKTKFTLLYKLFILSLLLIFLLTSCTTTINYTDDIEDKSPLKIYLFIDYSAWRNSDWSIKKLIEHYNMLSSKDRIDVEIIEYEYEKAAIMYERILNEISVGEGPDLIAISPESDKHLNITKLSNQNVFADMNILIENSETFDITMYNQSALDTGIINSKRIFMPISYNVEYLMTIKECLEGNELDIPDKLSLETYMQQVETYYENKSYNQAMLGIDIIDILDYSINQNGMFENNTITKRLFSIAKNESTRTINTALNLGETYYESYQAVKSFINSNYLYSVVDCTGRSQLEDLYTQYNIVENIYDSNFLWYEYPFNEDGQTIATIDRGLAININSNRKNEAFKFIEYVLTYSAQSVRTNMSNLPVNKKAFDSGKSNFLEGYDYLMPEYENSYSRLPSGPLQSESPLPAESAEEYIKYVESANQYRYLGNIQYIYYNIIFESIEDYYNDRITYDEMIDEMNNKLTIYYSE